MLRRRGLFAPPIIAHLHAMPPEAHAALGRKCVRRLVRERTVRIGLLAVMAIAAAGTVLASQVCSVLFQSSNPILSAGIGGVLAGMVHHIIVQRVNFRVLDRLVLDELRSLNRCMTCGYSLSHLPDESVCCPECGRTTDARRPA